MKNLTHRFNGHQYTGWFRLLQTPFIFLISLLFLVDHSVAQITQVGAATTAGNSGTTITINKPAGIQVGDVLLANIVQDDNSGGTDLNVNVTSTGWTSIDGRHLGGTNPEWWGTVLYKIAVLADVSAVSYVFTLDGDADGGIGSIVAFRNVNITGGVTETGGAGGPFDLDPGIINGIATDNSLSAASITTTSANAAVIMFGLMGDNDNDNVTGWTTTSPGALTELYENENSNGDDQTVAAAWAIKASAGATGAGSATLANSNINGSLLIALKGCTPPSVNPIGGGASLVCIGAMTPAFTNTTPGGVWSTSNTGIATINSMSGVATGVANGTVNVIYTVTDMSGCSASATASLTVGVPAQPSTITGPSSVAPNAMGVAYSVTNVPGVTYTWAFSPGGAGWTIATGQGSSSITINAGTIFPQTLTVTPSNSCGNGAPRSIAITNADCTAPVYCTQCNTSCNEPTEENPDLMGSCASLKVVLVIDESTSIGGSEADVEAGVLAFVNTLSCTGVQLAVIEFNNQARFVLDTSTVWYHNVDNNVVTAIGAYNTNGTNSLLLNSADYSPNSGTNYTNWHAAMLAVDHIPESPNLVIFFTDGVPTKVYLTNPPPNFGTDGTQCGGTGDPELAEYENPAKVANKLKCEGVHMFVAGVGGILGNEEYAEEISGTVQYVNGINDITNSDYATGDFDELALGLATFVSELCPFDSEVTSQDICPGGTNGSITITLPGNLLPYNYEYYNDDTNVLLGSGNNIFTNPLVISGLMAGNYRIEVEVTLPGSGCTRTEIFFETISAGAVEVVASVTSTTQPSCLNPDDGTATVTITAGVAPFTITLKKGGVTEPGYPIMTNATMYTATGLDAGSYTFEITDVNNCNTDVDGFTLNPPTNCCPETCTVTGGPGGNVCPDTESSFGATAEGCTTPTYSWALINNTSNAFIVGSTTSPTVTVNSGTICGSYTIQSTLTCMGCSPLICTQVVNVVDVTPPSFTFCPSGSDIGCNPSDVPAPGAATATDNCGTPMITSSLGSIIPNGCLRTQTRTYTATDACGNTATCTQVFTWTVDVTPPVFTFCPPGSDLGCNPGGVPAPGAATATDDCGTPGITSSLGSVIPNGCLRTQTRTYTATDGCGNTSTCTQVFTWTVDVTPPVFTFCPPGSDLGCNPGGVPAPGAATATDDCGTPGITSSLGSVIPNGCLRTQTRTYTATDGCGNTATCTQVFTWTVDVTPPVFTFCPLGSDLGCNPGGVPAPGAAIATDDCGTPGITSSLGSVIPNGCFRSQTRTYIATDGCGNTATCTQVFTWTVDVTPPVFTFCPLGSDLGCNPGGVPAPGAAIATDDCGTPGITSSLGSVIPNGCLRTQTRTYTATDGCGNTSTCTQVFTWTVDVTPPVFTFCPPGSDLGCNPGGVPAPGAAIATDDCGTPGITSSLGSVIPNGCLRTQTRTYTATDGCGNTSTCTQVFTWTVDVTPPVFTFCPPGSNLGCNPGGVPAPGAATATDDCGTPGITSSLGAIIPDGCFRSQTRTYTATDGCGNTSTCTQVFTWTVDVTPPVFTFCPLGSDLGCNPGGVPAPGAATAADDCGTPGITSSLGSVIPNGCLRTQTRTYTATDGCGNTSTCTQVFTWTVDVTPPVFTFCPPGSDLGCNPGGVPAPGAATATDDCGTPGITSSLGAIIPDGCFRSQTRTYTATDGCGNTATCTQVFTWTVDVTPPVFTFCPPGSDLGCNPGGVPAPGAAIATDDCGTPGITSSLGSIIPDGCFRSQTRTYTATDGCGNTSTCTQVFTWTVDVTPPVFTFCPPGSDLGCNPGGVPAPGAATATDDCGTPGITSSLGSIIPDGCFRSQTRTYTATDGCGNTATCAQVFTWTVDVTPPVFTFCPPGSNLGCNPIDVPAPGAAIATDDCGTPGITSSLGAIIPDGCFRSQTRTYTATDGCGNTSTCTQVFTWTVDVTPPVFTFCPPGSDLGCNPIDVPAPGAAIATDDCGTPGITSSLGAIIPDGCFRSQTRTYTATDGCGNTSTCTQVFTWTVDVTPPVFTFCPPGSDLGCNPGGVPAPGAATATDDCGTPGITSSLGSIIPDGCFRSQTRTYTATDGCGNTSTCTQVFTWTVDVTPPVFTFCPPGSDLGCNPGGVPAPGAATATDDCGTPGITSSLGGIIPDGCFRSQTRTYTATDGCGNTSTCTQVFTWTVDVIPPVFTFCPPGSDLGCNPGGVPAPGAATATDDCGTPGITSSLGTIIPDGCFRSQTRTYTATDGCGNTATCTQVFTWTVDVTPPVFTFCPPGSDLGCNPEGVPAPGVAIATDDCGTPGITSSLGTIIPDGCFRSQTRTYTATDGCGNTSTCTQVFTWTVDVTPPVFTFCPPGSDLGCNPEGVPAPGAAIATDDCGTPGITSSLGSVIPNGCLRTQTRTYTATDGCGNTSTCTQVFTWTVDVTPPVFTFCPPGSDLGCNPGGVPAPGAATATDDCGTPGITSSLGGIIPDGCFRSQTRTYTATDGCGNTSTCTQVFTWTVDVTPPVFTFCPPGSDLGCNPEGVPAPGAAIATDDCGTPGITSSLGSIIPDGCFRSQTRTYTATDGCGNTATCTQVFTWTVDVTPPVFTFCPPGSDLGCNPEGVPAPGAAIATDDCGSPGITSSLGSIIPDGCFRSQTRTYTATDGCGNTATCTQVFTWTFDLTPPEFTFCPPGSDLGCNPSGVPAPGSATATDDCGSVDITSLLGAVIPDGCFRSQARTYKATDGCGNTSTCTQVFTWTVDTAPPTCMTQNITLEVDPAIGYVLITPAQIDNGSSDSCGMVTLEIDIDSFTCFDEGANLVILTVTDMCGNTSSCSATVTIDQCFDPCVRLNTWVYLEGSATDPSGLPNNYTIPMRTNLNDLQILPGQTLVDPFFGNKYSPPGQPYTIAPWNYTGTEGDAFDSGGDPMMGDAGYPPTVVDWVLVGLRADPAGTGGPVCQAAALLHSDGYIQFVAPFECCELNLMDSFYIVVEHRNHLIVMSHMKLPIVPGADSSIITYDFRIQQSYEDDPFGFGVFAQKEINPGVYAMYAGNGDQTLSGQSDTDINFDDRSFWELENGDIGEYRIGDYNLNGDTNFNDRLTWERNNGSFTSVPRD